MGGASSSTATSATDSTTDRPNHPDETRDDEATESTDGADDYADDELYDDPFGAGWHAQDDDTGSDEWNGIVDFSKPCVAYISPDDSEEVTRMKRERARAAADRLRHGGDPYGDYTRRENGEALNE